MAGDAGADAAPPPPDAAALEALSTDAWATLLIHARAVLEDLAPDELSPAAGRLRSVPTSRLAGGRGRTRLCALLADGGLAWARLHARLAAEPDLPADLVDLLRAADEATTPPGADPPQHGAAERLRSRLREARADRDRWRRRAEGAEARSAALETEIDALRAALAEAEATAARLEQQVATTADEQQRAVDRERRRRDAELAELRRELADLRREAEERRRREGQRGERPAARRPPAGDRGRAGGRPPRTGTAVPPRVAPGRPTHLPEGVRTDTAAGVRLLLEPGRLVLVDGYNVTLQHRAHLELERQRTWLIQLLGALAARRRVRPVVVFDGGSRPVPGTVPRVRGVEVRFTPVGIAADDEIVLAVEGTDDPVLVVTDDRELQARVRAAGADVVGAGPFLWAAGAGSP